jgi:hypothetical protein
MISMQEFPRTNVFELVLDGPVSAAEFDAIIARLEAAIATHGKIRVLEVVKELGGVPPSKWWDDLKFGYRHMRDIERAAIVAEQRWLEVFANLVNPFFSAELKYFKPAEIERARAWLAANPA